MKLETAVSFILEMCFRIFGLCILIAASTVPIQNREQRRYIREQRDIMKRMQEDVELIIMLEEDVIE